MSWVDWVTGYICNHTESSGECVYGICLRGAIVSAADGTIWGQHGFALQEYELPLEDDNGKTITGVVNEFNNLKNAWENGGKTKNYGGLRFCQEKFTLARFDEDSETMYLSGKDSGACVAKSGQCFVIGIHYKTGQMLATSLGKERNYSPGNANAAVENCRDKLVDAGY
jgi:hypothetical protein